MTQENRKRQRREEETDETLPKVGTSWSALIHCASNPNGNVHEATYLSNELKQHIYISDLN